MILASIYCFCYCCCSISIIVIRCIQRSRGANDDHFGANGSHSSASGAAKSAKKRNSLKNRLNGGRRGKSAPSPRISERDRYKNTNNNNYGRQQQINYDDWSDDFSLSNRERRARYAL